MLESLSKDRPNREAVMNYSICSADRTTHLKIVVVALAASIGIANFGIAAHFKASDQYSRTANVVKAGKPNLRFAVALPGRQDTLPDLTFVNGYPVLSGTQIK
jgi:hypothetical protein